MDALTTDFIYFDVDIYHLVLSIYIAKAPLNHENRRKLKNLLAIRSPRPSKLNPVTPALLSDNPTTLLIP